MRTTSNQEQEHEDLEKVVRKHLESNYQKPIADHCKIAFDLLLTNINDTSLPIILDSGCGTAQSCLWLSNEYPGHQIIGVDKSALRLSKASQKNAQIALCRCDLEDFWRLAIEAGLKIHKHYLLYPNPWPKKKHIMRRWQGHPVFPILLKLGNELILRSDWIIYIKEFELALRTAGINNINRKQITIRDNAISAFEQKYIEQQRELFELRASLI